jgi:hypothetical protein
MVSTYSFSNWGALVGRLDDELVTEAVPGGAVDLPDPLVQPTAAASTVRPVIVTATRAVKGLMVSSTDVGHRPGWTRT